MSVVELVLVDSSSVFVIVEYFRECLSFFISFSVVVIYFSFGGEGRGIS